MAKFNMSALTVFDINESSVLCVTNQFTLTVNAETVDVSCLNDVWMTEALVGKSWTLSCSGQINTEVFGTRTLINNPAVSVAITTGAGGYTGNGIIKTATHGGQRRQEQTESFEITGSGPLTYITND